MYDVHNSQPVRQVTLDAYWIDKYEVTKRQYQQCVDLEVCSKPSIAFGADYDQHPVFGVTWYQAETYCDWVEGRLPSEAEWEKAARGEHGNKYPWGNEAPSARLLNFKNTKGTMPVGSFPEGASPYGALDMAGNVQEWVYDWYAETYDAEQTKNPQGSKNGTNRVLRGGYSGSYSITVHSAFRTYANPVTITKYWYYYGTPFYDNIIGFRCVSSP